MKQCEANLNFGKLGYPIEQCKNDALEDSDYCDEHQSYDEEEDT